MLYSNVALGVPLGAVHRNTKACAPYGLKHTRKMHKPKALCAINLKPCGIAPKPVHDASLMHATKAYALYGHFYIKHPIARLRNRRTYNHD